MARTELPWLLWDRHIRPLSLGVSVACMFLVALILTNNSVWGQQDWWSLTVAVIAGAGTLALWVGFWVPSTVLMQHGLMCAAIAFAARGGYIGSTGGWSLSATLTSGLSWSLTLMAGGAWLLERATGGRGFGSEQ